MKRPRFRVLTVTGYNINPPFFGVSSQRHPTVSATVIDGLWNCQEIKTYRAEDRVHRNGVTGTRGNEDALRAAEDHAAYLNEQWKREQYRDWMREHRAAEPQTVIKRDYKRERTSRRQRGSTTEEGQTCPRCGDLYAWSARYCQACRMPLR